MLGGDINLRKPAVPPGFVHAAGHEVDHIFARGFEVAGSGQVLEQPVAGGAHLSDHAPLVAILELPKA